MTSMLCSSPDTWPSSAAMYFWCSARASWRMVLSISPLRSECDAHPLVVDAVAQLVDPGRQLARTASDPLSRTDFMTNWYDSTSGSVCSSSSAL